MANKRLKKALRKHSIRAVIVKKQEKQNTAEENSALAYIRAYSNHREHKDRNR